MGKRWSDDEDARLVEAWSGGSTLTELMALHERSRNGVRSRLRKLGLIPAGRPSPLPESTHGMRVTGHPESLEDSEDHPRALPAKPACHGQPWSDDNIQAVIAQFNRGDHIGKIARRFGRTPRSIALQLHARGFLPKDRVNDFPALASAAQDRAAPTTPSNANPPDLAGSTFGDMDTLDAMIGRFGLSARCRSALERASILTVEALAVADVTRLLRMQNVGRRTINELTAAKADILRDMGRRGMDRRDMGLRDVGHAQVAQGMVGIEEVHSRSGRDEDGRLQSVPEPVFADVPDSLDGFEACLQVCLERFDTALEYHVAASLAAGLPRQSEIARERWLAEPGDALTLQALGERWGVTRERVRQVEVKLLRRVLAAMFPPQVRERLRAARQRLGEDAAREFAQIGLDLELDPSLRNQLLPEIWRRCHQPRQSVKTARAQVNHAIKALHSHERRQVRAMARAGRLVADVEHLLDGVVWPLSTPTEDALADFAHDRTGEAWGHLAEFGPSRLGQGLVTESGLETAYITAFEASPIVREVRTQSLRIPYAHGRRHYHPDFHVFLHDGRQVVVEVKGATWLTTVRTLAKRAVARKALWTHGVPYRLVAGRGRDLNWLARRDVPPARESSLLAALEAGGGALDRAEIVDWIRADTNGQFDLQALVLRHRLDYRSRPMRLSRPDPPLAPALFELSANPGGTMRRSSHID